VPRTALIVVDMLNAYEHPDAEALTRSVERVLPAIAGLVDRAGEESVLTIYVNDNFGSWTSDRDALLRQAMRGEHRRLVEPVAPRGDTPFVVKARHSIFFQTPLEFLLKEEQVDRLVLVGQVTEQCILYSALDAYIRKFRVVVPRDAVAHIHEDLAEAALRMMEVNMDAEIVDADRVVLDGRGDSGRAGAGTPRGSAGAPQRAS
jgi:nicotinamidase-related amidase